MEKIKEIFWGEHALQYERKISLAYKFLLFFYLFAQSLAVFHRTFVISVFLWGMLAVGAVNFIFRVTRLNRYVRTPYLWLLILFLCSDAFSIIVNMRYGFSQNFSHFVVLALMFVLLYANDVRRSSAEVFDDLLKIGKTHIVLMDISIIASLVMLFCNYGETIEIEDYRIKIGFVENRLWGVFRDPNHAAIFAIIAIVLTFYVFYKTKSKWMRAFLIFSDVLMFIYIAFSDSRTARYALLGCFACLIFLLLSRFGFKKLHQVLRQILAVVIAVFVGITASMLPNILIETYNEIVITVEENQPPSEDGEDEEGSRTIFRGYDLEKDPMNKRTEIWKNGLALFEEKPLFGVTFFDIKSYLRQEMPDAFIIQEGQTFSHFHNEILNVAVSQGILGVAILGIFAICLAVSILKYYFRAPNRTYLQMTFALVPLLGLCCEMLVQQGPIYNYSPSVFFFWGFLGYLALAARELRHQKLAQKSERFAFACDTPLQVVNCASFVLNDVQGSKGHSDIYIYHQFKGSRELAERLQQAGIFNHVYNIGVYQSHTSLIGKLSTLLRLLFAKHTIQKNASEKIGMNRKAYSAICTSFPTTFTTGLHDAYPEAEVYLIEDGAGSYFGDIVNDYSTGFFKFVDRFFCGNELSIQPQAIYLSSPQLSRNSLSCEIRQLPALSEGDIGKIEKVFDYKENDLYRSSRIVYLTQPIAEKKGFLPEREKELEALLSTLGNQAVARIHPRQADKQVPGLQRDTYANLWELECMEQIGSDHVLIGAFSTAQFMPKLLKNAEPVVICTYKLLFNDLTDPFWQGAEKFIADFKAMYSDPEKIQVPETLDELKELLSRIRDGR